MTRNLKALGLTLVAMLALGAMTASAASAQTNGKLTSASPVVLVGTEQGAVSENRLTAFNLFVQCPDSTYTGYKHNVTPHEAIPSGVSTGTIVPDYLETVAGTANCDATVGSATIHMNGCDYVVHLGETTGGVNGTYGVTFDVVCPVGKEITVTVYSSHTHTEPFCIMHVPGNQNGLKGAHATDNGNGTVTLSGTVEGITVNKTTNGAPLLCPNAHTAVGKFDLNVLIKGFDKVGGTQKSISLSH